MDDAAQAAARDAPRRAACSTLWSRSTRPRLAGPTLARRGPVRRARRSSRLDFLARHLNSCEECASIAPRRALECLFGSVGPGCTCRREERCLQGLNRSGGRTSTPRLRRFAFLVVALVALTAATQTLADNGGGPSWNMIGNDSANSRNNPFESQISTANASQLAPKWSLPSSTPGRAAEPVRDDDGRRLRHPGSREGSGLLRRLRRHGVEARRRQRPGHLVASRSPTTPGSATISRARARSSRATR